MRTAGAALLLLAACGREGGGNRAEAEAPAVVSVALQSEDAIDGIRPLLTLSCGAGGASFWLDLVRIPEPAPPARGTFGAIKVDDAAPVRVELTWLGAARWAPRLPHAEEGRLARAMLAGRNVYFAGPEGSTDRAYRWDIDRLGADLGLLRGACGSG